MINKKEIADSIFAAIDTIVDKKITDLHFNTSIVGKILSKQNGVYTVQYQAQTFNAIALTSVDYPLDSYVYVLIPNNDYQKQKFILGQAINGNSNARIANIDLATQVAQLSERVIALESQCEQLLAQINTLKQE